MKHRYAVWVDPATKAAVRAFRAIVKAHPNVELGGSGEVAHGQERALRALVADARVHGIPCHLEVSTTFERQDALSGELGRLSLGLESTSGFKAMLPHDAFDLSTGCLECGLGCKQVKPYFLTEKTVHCAGAFHASEQSSRFLMRSEIGRKIMEATGQPDCMRYAATRNGRVVKEWLEPVPTFTMPPLSPATKGVVFARVNSADASRVECRTSGRKAWDKGNDEATRLVYSEAAAS